MGEIDGQKRLFALPFVPVRHRSVVAHVGRVPQCSAVSSDLLRVARIKDGGPCLCHFPCLSLKRAPAALARRFPNGATLPDRKGCAASRFPRRDELLARG